MNDLTKGETQEEKIETTGFEGFTPEEVLIGKSILLQKAGQGLVSRLGCAMRELRTIHNVPAEFDQLSFCFDKQYCKLSKENNALIREYARTLGISSERLEEIKYHVYEKETTL